MQGLQDKIRRSLLKAAVASEKMNEAPYTKYISLGGLGLHSSDNVKGLARLIVDFKKLVEGIYYVMPITDFINSTIFMIFDLDSDLQFAADTDEFTEETLLRDYFTHTDLLTLGLGAIDTYLSRNNIRGNVFIDFSDDLCVGELTVNIALLFTITENGSRVKYYMFDAETYMP